MQNVIKLLLVICLVVSCRSSKEIAARKAAKEETARQEHMKLLQEVRDKLPCVPVQPLKQGITVYIPGETLPCPDGKDSVKCPDSQNRTDTLYIVDEAALQAVRDSLSSANYRWDLMLDEYNKEVARADKAESELKTSNGDKSYWKIRAISTWGIIGLLAGGAIFSKIKGII